MANYHEYCTRECIDPELLGIGTGDTKDGELRICISLEGKQINQDSLTDNYWDEKVRWVSLTPEVAKNLYECLGGLKHLWEKK